MVVTLVHIPLKLPGMKCQTCGHGSRAGLDFWNVAGYPEHMGVLICYQCAIRALADIGTAGIRVEVEVVNS